MGTRLVVVRDENHTAQLLSYLKLSHKKLGVLLNFHVVHLREGIKRVANNL